MRWINMISVYPGGRPYAASECVTGPHEGTIRVEQQRVAYMTPEEFAAFSEAHSGEEE